MTEWSWRTRFKQGLTSHHEVGTGQVREAWCTNLAPVGTVGTVGHEVHTHLALRCLDRAVGLARGDGVTLAEELPFPEVSGGPRGYSWGGIP